MYERWIWREGGRAGAAATRAAASGPGGTRTQIAERGKYRFGLLSTAFGCASSSTSHCSIPTVQDHHSSVLPFYVFHMPNSFTSSTLSAYHVCLVPYHVGISPVSPGGVIHCIKTGISRRCHIIGPVSPGGYIFSVYSPLCFFVWVQPSGSYRRGD